MSIELVSETQLVGSVIGGYRVLSCIGTGTMGHVYEAEDISAGGRVALKVLRKSRQKDLPARFLREGKTLALLSHPNIVQLVDMGQFDDGTLFLATELIRGGSLRQLMDREAIDPRRALVMIKQLLGALDAAHGLGVVHRDIKPENVMVAAGDEIKVLDFGVAKLLADTVAALGEANLTAVGFSIFGSALYIAPESVTGQPVDARIDIYSTGAMLFEMLAGRPPFDDHDPAVLLQRHAFAEPPTLAQAAPARTFSPAIEALVARALEKQPDARYRSAADMIEAVDAALQALDRPIVTVPVEAAPAAYRQPDQQRARTHVVRLSRRKELIIAGAAAAVVLVVIVLLVVTRVSRTATGTSSLATRASKLVQAGSNSDAVALLERELAGRTTKEHAGAYLVLGHAQFALGHHQQAVGAYERALRVAPALAENQEVHGNLLKVLDGKDALASVVAVELLAQLDPPALDAITTYASTGKLADARHRAIMIAERDGVGHNVDRVESWSLDLLQASVCEDRKAIIQSLVGANDRRALVALKRVRAVKCVEREATDAIARIEASAK
jgi:eukaryotic-like serine/threonine-protein kinase